MSDLLNIQGLCVDYAVGGGSVFRAQRKRRVVTDFNMRISAGQTVGLVGESGSGKSTVGQVIMGNVPISAGQVRVGQWQLDGFSGRPPFEYCGAVQMVWQNPYASLTPTARVGDLLQEALDYCAQIKGAAPAYSVFDLLLRVGLAHSDREKYPHEFSGGQQQRIVLARALALEPRLIILDEATSALDVITQSQILTLLRNIQDETGLAYLLISHDLGVVRCMADQVIVLNQGEIMEAGQVDEVCGRPASPYTRLLIDSILEPPL